MTTVLVTGASGFIGRAACAAFAKRGWEVRAGVRADANADGVLSVRGSLEQGWPLDGVGVVVHLAGIAHQIHAQNAEAVYQAMNCQATERLARAAMQAGVRRFVFMSSIKVNGERTPIDQPFRASDTPQPEDRYARSKRDAEQMLTRLGGQMEIVVVRPPLVYGPGVRANFLRLVRLVDRRLPLPFGAIRNRRSLIYVGNLADLIVAAASSPEAAGRTLLASDGEDMSTPRLISEIGRALGRPARLIRVPVRLLRLGGTITGMGAEIGRLVDSLVVELNETRKGLNWQPPFSVEEGIANTVRWYQAARSSA